MVANNLLVLYILSNADDKLEKSLQYCESMIKEDSTRYCNDVFVSNFMKIYNLMYNMTILDKNRLKVMS